MAIRSTHRSSGWPFFFLSYWHFTAAVPLDALLQDMGLQMNKKRGLCNDPCPCFGLLDGWKSVRSCSIRCMHISLFLLPSSVETSANRIGSMVVILFVFLSFFFLGCRSKQGEERGDATEINGIADSSISRCHDGRARGQTYTCSPLLMSPPLFV